MTYTKNRYLPGSARLQRFLALLDLYITQLIVSKNQSLRYRRILRTLRQLY
jgi:hypothetical protein